MNIILEDLITDVRLLWGKQNSLYSSQFAL